MSRRPAVDFGLPQYCWWASGWVIAAATFTAAYNSWRPGELLFTLSDGLFLLGALLALMAGRLPLQPVGAWTPLWVGGLIAMLGGLLVGSMANGDPQRWLTVALQYTFSLLLLPALLLQNSGKRTLLFFKALVTGVFCMEAFGLLVYFAYDGTHADYSRFGPEFITGAGRLAAFLADANWNAAAIVSTIPFVLVLRISGHISALRCLVFLAVFFTALLCAASVTGLVSCLLAILIFCVVARVRISKRAVLAVGVSISLLTLSGYGLPRAFTNRIAPALEAGDIEQAGTYRGREDLIVEAWRIVEDTSLVGLGVDQYRVVSVEKAPVHNIYLLLWAEGGLLALVGWLVLLATIAAIATVVRRQSRMAAALALSVLAPFVIFSNAAPHMYARFWIVPIMLAMAPALAIGAQSIKLHAATRLRHMRRRAQIERLGLSLAP